MEMDLSIWLQLAVVLVCVAVGGRLGGVGLGAAGGLGVCILVLGMGIQPGSPPTSVLLIITAVIACTSVLQGSGGLDLLVRWAEKLLRKWPRAITFVGPFVCSFFVMLVGTAYVAFAVYPVVAEVAASAKVRPAHVRGHGRYGGHHGDPRRGLLADSGGDRPNLPPDDLCDGAFRFLARR